MSLEFFQWCNNIAIRHIHGESGAFMRLGTHNILGYWDVPPKQIGKAPEGYSLGRGIPCGPALFSRTPRSKIFLG